jgi:hypothetical protein
MNTCRGSVTLSPVAKKNFLSNLFTNTPYLFKQASPAFYLNKPALYNYILFIHN